MRDSKRDKEVKSRLLDSVGEGEGVGPSSSLPLPLTQESQGCLLDLGPDYFFFWGLPRMEDLGLVGVPEFSRGRRATCCQASR